jgi:hypothetical protein
LKLVSGQFDLRKRYRLRLGAELHQVQVAALDADRPTILFDFSLDETGP